jgi:hypothetical protein
MPLLRLPESEAAPAARIEHPAGITGGVLRQAGALETRLKTGALHTATRWHAMCHARASGSVSRDCAYGRYTDA